VASSDSLHFEKIPRTARVNGQPSRGAPTVLARIACVGVTYIPFRSHHLPGDPRTKQKRRSRKKAVCFQGNRIDNSTACFVSSGISNLAAFPGVAKYFFDLLQHFDSASENKRTIIPGQIASSLDELKPGLTENIRYVRLLIESDLHCDPAVILEMVGSTRRNEAVGLQAVLASVKC